jgi:DNA polymerase III delta subunit
MELTILTGDDTGAVQDRTRALLAAAAGDVEYIDVTEAAAALVDAVAAVDMFGGRRVVVADGFEQLPVSVAQQIARFGPSSNAVVVGRCAGAVPAAVKAVLKDVAVFESCAVPKGRGVHTRITELAGRYGVRLRSSQRAVLASRTGHDLDRLASVLRLLWLVGVTEPTDAQLDELTATLQPPGTPWQLSDAIEAGRAGEAADLAGRADPVPALTYLLGRYAQVARAAEAAVSGPDEVQVLLGVKHRFQAEQIARLAGRIGPGGAARLWVILAGADRAVKTSRPGPVFVHTVVSLCTVFHR